MSNSKILKTVNLVCNEYLDLDSNYQLDFKSSLAREIKKGEITKDDALFLILEILRLVNADILKYKYVTLKLQKLTEEVKRYNSGKNPDLKYKVLFFRPYFIEMQNVIDFIISLAGSHDIDFENKNYQVYSSNDKKLIKNYLNGFSRDDLCYILDLNPELNFEKEKILKNRIIDQLLANSHGFDNLGDSSKDDIKERINFKSKSPISAKEVIKLQNQNLFDLLDKFKVDYQIKLKKDHEKKLKEKRKKEEQERQRKIFEENRKKEAEKRRKLEEKRIKEESERQRKILEEKRKRDAEIEKKKAQKVHKIKFISSKVKNFNDKSLSEMILLKEDYLEIYEKINEEYSIYQDIKEINDFKIYYSNFDKIKEIIEYGNKINENYNINDFFSILISSGYLSANKRNKIIKKYAGLYELTLKIDEFPDLIKNKLFKENPRLEHVKKTYEDLLNYTNISQLGHNSIRLINKRNLDAKIIQNEEFFEDITDVNKKRAIVIDEDNVKVIAGAGTGKTFTLQKKVKYLIEKKGVDPDKILCLCYTAKGAEDLDNKVNHNRGENKVEACTFHEFSRRVARSCGINKSTNRYLLDQVIRNYTRDILDDDKKINILMDYFSYYMTPPEDIKKFNTYEELLAYETGQDLKTLKEKYYEACAVKETLKGEEVKSLGELIIANYLFMHEIDYIYQKNYDHSFAELIEHRFLHSGKFFSLVNMDLKEKIVKNCIDYELRWERHQPDFYLPKYDIFLEHFGINYENNEIWLGEDYEDTINRKIQVHELHGTKLLKTYYYYLVEGRLLEELEKKLIQNGVKIGQMNRKDVLNILIKTNKIHDYNNFINLIKNFINIFEAQNRDKKEFDDFKNDNKQVKDGYKQKRQELFLDIVSDIYDRYCKLNDSETIDHNREISIALELIESREYRKSYDYILIDEYQDINQIRCKLIQELQKSSNAKVFVVGDDWQSIYRFNGSEVELFIDFEKYFPNCEVIKLEENRRNPQKIINVSSKFILKNKNQEKKKLRYYKPSGNTNLNPIKIVTYDAKPKNNKVLKLDAIFENILRLNKKSNLRVLLLGRKNNDIEKFTNNNVFKRKEVSKNVFKISYSKKQDLDITFMSIHKAKGLEYDEVIILNFENKISGFPNQIDDDPLLLFVKDYEECPFAEERRLLYVALTRTRNNVYLLAPSQDASIFIDELKDKFYIKVRKLAIDNKTRREYYQPSDFIEEFEYVKTNIKCPNCEDGKITIVSNNLKGTKYIRCSTDPTPWSNHYNGGPYWGSLEDVKYIEKCPKCRGVLIRNGDILKCCLNSSEGCMETKELKLDKEDMEYDE